MVRTCVYKGKVENVFQQKKHMFLTKNENIMDKFKPFPYVFKYFNETRKKYYNGKVIGDASEENNNFKCFSWDLRKT